MLDTYQSGAVPWQRPAPSTEGSAPMPPERNTRRPVNRRRPKQEPARAAGNSIGHWRQTYQPCFVYAIAEYDLDRFGQATERTGFVKVGAANDPRKRVAELQTGNPRELRLLAAIYGDEETERIVHDHFIEARVLGGEWFGPEAADTIVAMFKEIDWRQRTCGSLNQEVLCVRIVWDVLRNREARKYDA